MRELKYSRNEIDSKRIKIFQKLNRQLENGTILEIRQIARKLEYSRNQINNKRVKIFQKLEKQQES